MQPAALILRDHPDHNDSGSASGLRLAGALMADDRDVRIFLLDRGVTLAHGGEASCELLHELIELGALVRACGLCLDRHGISECRLPAGIERSSMKELAQWCGDSQVFLF